MKIDKMFHDALKKSDVEIAKLEQELRDNRRTFIQGMVLILIFVAAVVWSLW